MVQFTGELREMGEGERLRAYKGNGTMVWERCGVRTGRGEWGGVTGM
jgi:hypothetical protein